VNIGGGIGIALAALALLTGLAAVATFIALGTQRGRVERLETRNADLEMEVGDLERRRQRVATDLQGEVDRGIRQQSVIDHLKGEIDTLSKIPLEALAKSMEQALELLAAHHREAMFGQELQAGMMLDLLHMNGDKRDKQTIAEAMRVQQQATHRPRSLGPSGE
jgi:hypothetical protein